MSSAQSVIHTIVDTYASVYPEEVAGYLDKQSPAAIVSFMNRLKPQEIMRILYRLAPTVASVTLARLDDRLLKSIVPLMDLHRVVILVHQWEVEFREAKLEVLDPETAKDIRALLCYTSDQAGHYMDPHILSYRPETTLKTIRTTLPSRNTKKIHNVYIVDQEGLLLGSISLQDMFLSENTETIGNLIQREPIAVQAVSSREEVIELFSKGRLTTLPVVDYDGRLLGVIRQQAMMDVVESETSIDIQTMVGVSKDERALSKVSFSIKKRLPWLQINLVTAFLAASVVGLFEHTIAQFTALAVLMPVVAGQSGNTGAQALAVTMRGLVLREVRVRQWPRIVWKEARVGFVNGLAVALTTAIAVYIWDQSVGLSAVIALAMIISMVAASLAGALIPVLLSLVGQDPATSSSIILTTVTDVVGFFSFLGLATVLSSLLV